MPLRSIHIVTDGKILLFFMANIPLYLYTIYTYCCCCLVAKFRLSCNSMDYSLSGSSVHGISQARILEWVAISFTRGLSQFTDQTLVSCIGRHGLPQWISDNESLCQCRRCGRREFDLWVGKIPGLGRSLGWGGGNGKPFQYSCSENPMDRGDWRVVVHKVTKCSTRLSKQTHTHIDTHTHTHIHTPIPQFFIH